jgi:hypothetical protein
MGAFESMMPKRIFGNKSEKVSVGWRRLHNEELRNLLPSPNIRGPFAKFVDWRHCAAVMQVVVVEVT